MRNIRRAVAVIGAALLIALAGSASVSAGQDKVTLCHAAGLDGTTQYVTITVAYPAAFGEAGHFFENGTPRAGHEEDYLGPCIESSPSPSASPEPSVEPSSPPPPPPTPSPDPSASPTPSSTPTPTPSASPTAPPTVTPTAPPTDVNPTLPPTDTEGNYEATSSLDLNGLLIGIGLFTLSFVLLGGLDALKRRT